MNTPKIDNAIEYKLRVPRNLVKDYYVMKLNSPRPVNFSEITDAYVSRKALTQGDDDSSVSQSAGAGSEYGKDWKEDMKKRRRGQVKKEVTKEDMLYSLKLCGKKSKRFNGKREGTILENSAYYILTQCPDGVFEAVPIQAWYSFNPTINYQTLSLDDVEKEFSKRDKTMNYHNMMVQKRLMAAADADDSAFTGDKVKSTYRDGLVIHDDEENSHSEGFGDSESEDSEDSKQKKGKKNRKKDTYANKKKKKGDGDDEDQDSDEEEEFDNFESKECDYMSESSSNDEAELLEDEPEPETNNRTKAKDDLNAFALSDSEEEEETEEGLTSAGKELKEILKREEGNEDSSSDEDEDIDDDEKYSKSALFMQGSDGKKKKSGRSGSVSGSSSSSRSATPTMQTDSNQGTPKSGKSQKDGKSRKNGSSRSTPTQQSGKKEYDVMLSRKRPNSKEPADATPPNKKGKIHHKSPGQRSSSKQSKEAKETKKQHSSIPVADKIDASNSKEPLAITESTIRRYLAHKPMTTTDLVKKFKTKKTGLTREQTVSTIAAILKRIGPERQHIDGKLYLSIKPSKK